MSLMVLVVIIYLLIFKRRSFHLGSYRRLSFEIKQNGDADIRLKENDMKKVIRTLVAVLAMALSFSGKVFALDGSWRGELTLGQIKLPLVFHFSEMPDGKTLCTLDSPSQGAKDIPAEVVFCISDSIILTINAIGASYTGRVADDVIVGVFRQQGYEFPLCLSPDIPIEERRPQTPKPPFPYQAIDTAFTTYDGTVMGATLTIPLNAISKKNPAVVMISGSGPQNRDEELFEHKPFAVIADYLARHGIASLRYDDRGTGKSTGNHKTATTYTFKDDALSGIKFLRSIATVGKVGALEHSEGGTIAFMLGSELETDFIISLAGMAITGKETLMRQNGHGFDAMNLSVTDKENSLKLLELLFDTMAEQALRKMPAEIDVDSLIGAAQLVVPQQVITSVKTTQRVRTLWFDTFLTLNPRDYLGKVKCPTLAINGEKDVQVNVDNIDVIKELVPHAKTIPMSGLNHLMQHAVTGDVSEYGEIRETISPEVLDAIVMFVKAL